jgi:hypothetical protein
VAVARFTAYPDVGIGAMAVTAIARTVVQINQSRKYSVSALTGVERDAL